MTNRILGALQPQTPDGVEFIDLGDRLVLKATTDLVGIAGERFSKSTTGATFAPSEFTAPGVSLVGYAYTQFAYPVRAKPGRGFNFRPAHNLRSPSAVMPLLLVSSDGRFELLAPLDAWHEQAIAVKQSDDDQGPVIDHFHWGWHGDLDQVHAGFTATLGIFTGTSASEVFNRWGDTIRAAAGTVRPSAEIDPLLTHLSYWTDNGAAYWYRTEANQDITTTIANKVDELDGLSVPVKSVELDSWFYPHETSRSVSETGYLEEVPPTGMLSWTPRPEVLPNGVDGVHRAVGKRPLVLHSRHISPRSDYVRSGDWWTGVASHPVDPDFFQQWFRDAASWGATCIEQDWMMSTFFYIPELRSQPGRTMEWQRGLNTAASTNGLTLLWCMALPGDFAATVELDRVIAIRTSDDYRYASDPADLWVWYLTVNMMAAALELPVFKDCFFSSTDTGESDIDGDQHAELEALLSSMSAGVVGIGDRIGRTDAEIVSRVCRPDGRLVGPDRAITLTDQSMSDAGQSGGLCWSMTHTTNQLGTWRYLVVINTSTDPLTVSDSYQLRSEVLVYSWRDKTAEVRTQIDVTLEPREWALFVCCPFVDPIESEPTVSAHGVASRERSALIGDPTRYATMGRTRVDVAGTIPRLLTAKGEPNQPLLWWSDPGGLHPQPDL